MEHTKAYKEYKKKGNTKFVRYSEGAEMYHMEDAKEQTEPKRAKAERVEAEVVYSPMVAEQQEYQYNADAFEARGVDDVKQEAEQKRAPKVREDKAR